MPSIFNIIRACVYGSVLVFTVICLAMAAQFEKVLALSDLTRFVPFALFVCAASLAIFTILLGFSVVLQGRNPISTRVELAALALATVFWISLGGFLAGSDSKDADVQCYTSDSSTDVLDDSVATFHTDQYQAMYRVLNAFSLVNAAIIGIWCLLLLLLVIRRHRNGDQHMWHAPVTHCAWFNNYGSTKTTAKPDRLTPILPVAAAHMRQHSRHHSGRSRRDRSRVYPSMRENGQNASGQSSLINSIVDDFNNGEMVNPNRTRR